MGKLLKFSFLGHCQEFIIFSDGSLDLHGYVVFEMVNNTL